MIHFKYHKLEGATTTITGNKFKGNASSAALQIASTYGNIVIADNLFEFSGKAAMKMGRDDYSTETNYTITGNTLKRIGSDELEGSIAIKYCGNNMTLNEKPMYPENVSVGAAGATGYDTLSEEAVQALVSANTGISESYSVATNKNECTFEYVAPKATITFNANAEGVTGSMDPISSVIGEPATLTLCAFSLTGYNFKGWATTPGGAVKYTDEATIDSVPGDMTLYAVWAQIVKPPVVPAGEGTVEADVSEEVNIDVDEANVPADAEVAQPAELAKANVTGVAEGVKEEVINKIIADAVEEAQQAAGKDDDIKIEVVVDTQVKLEEVEISTAEDEGEILYSVTPQVVVTTFIEGEKVDEAKIDIKNTDFNPAKQSFTVTLSCKGMVPKSVVHKEGDLIIDVFSGNDMNYKNDTVTVTINQFS